MPCGITERVYAVCLCALLTVGKQRKERKALLFLLAAYTPPLRIYICDLHLLCINRSPSLYGEGLCFS